MQEIEEKGNLPKAVEPRRQLAMKHENTVPKGIAAPAPNCEAWIAALSAGGHCNTKIYIAPKNKSCIIDSQY